MDALQTRNVSDDGLPAEEGLALLGFSLVTGGPPPSTSAVCAGRGPHPLGPF